jgi:hypothetical protein
VITGLRPHGHAFHGTDINANYGRREWGIQACMHLRARQARTRGPRHSIQRRARRVDVTARIDAWNKLISCVIRRHGAGPAGMIMGGRRVVTRGLRLPRLAMRTEYWVTRNTVSPLASSMAATQVTSSNRKDLGLPFPDGVSSCHPCLPHPKPIRLQCFW